MGEILLDTLKVCHPHCVPNPLVWRRYTKVLEFEFVPL